MRQQVYDEEIEPLLDEIVQLCRQHKIPAFFALEVDKRLHGHSIGIEKADPNLQAAVVMAKSTKIATA